MPALLAPAVLLGGCSSDAEPDEAAGREPAVSMEEFCRRYAEIGELQQSEETELTAGMELARLSLVAPEPVRQPMEVLYQLLEDRLAGGDVDFDAMADASLEIMDRCA